MYYGYVYLLGYRVKGGNAYIAWLPLCCGCFGGSLQELVGKKVRVIKNDGYTKVGVLVSLDANFAQLRLDRSGRLEYIAIGQIASATEVEQ